MKVLVTGGYGFIGSHVVETFYKEGYEVFIIDNLSSGSPDNVSCRHKSYTFDVEDRRCDEIFKNNAFDVVVHLAGRAGTSYSVENPFACIKANILGLLNMLELSDKYKVKRFIYASSAAVYGNNKKDMVDENTECNPLTPYGISSLAGEHFCLRWNNIYNLETVCLRLSNVYGPRQGLYGEGCVLSKYIENIIIGREITVYGHGDQTRDFIHVYDAAEVIFRAAESYITGIYNVSANMDHSINDIIYKLNRIKKVKGIIYKNAKKWDIMSSRLDNTRIKKELDWIPRFQFDEGISLTYEWYLKNNFERKTDSRKPQKRQYTKLVKAALPFIENAVSFIIVILLSRLLNTDSYFNVIDPCLIYIILMGAAYGTRQSLISGILSGLLNTYNSVTSGRDLFSLLLDTGYFSHILSYILVGTSVGYIVNKQNRQAHSDKLKNETLKEKCEFLQQMYNETYLVKSQLQQQILNYEDSYGKIYEIIKSLDNLNTRHLYESAVKVLEETLKADEICIYTVNTSQTYLELAAGSNKESFEPDKLIVFEYFNRIVNIKDLILKDKVFVNKDLVHGLPLLAAPVLYENRLREIIAVYNTNFDLLTLDYINLFKIMSKLINISLSKAHTFEMLTIPGKYAKGVTASHNSLTGISSRGQKHADHMIQTPLSGEEALEIETFGNPEEN